MKYLKEFRNHTEYEEARQNLILPNISYCVSENGVYYNPIISIADAIITCDSATYNGQTQVATNIVVTINGSTLVSGTDYTVSNNEGGVNAGDYTFTIDGIGNYSGSKNGTFTIDKAQGSVTTAPTAITGLTPTGSAQALVNAGSSDTGEMMYNLDGGAWSSSIPTATNVGSYTVGYKAAESTNYTESATGSVTVKIDYPYVDLGLTSGTKWAKYNVGATSESEYGNFYQYGKGADQYAATSGQSDYSGTEDPLATSVDTARQTWGGDWHMPTKAQFEELTANTTYEWTTVNGVSGGKFTAQNGNYIFIPAAGYWYDGSHGSEGSDGCVWSSSPNGSGYAFYLYFGSGGKRVYYYDRKYGSSVRPVVG